MPNDFKTPTIDQQNIYFIRSRSGVNYCDNEMLSRRSCLEFTWLGTMTVENMVSAEPITDMGLLQAYLAQMRRLQTLNVRLHQITAPLPLIEQLVSALAEMLPQRRTYVLVMNEDETGLRFAACSEPLPFDLHRQLESTHISTRYNVHDRMLGLWKKGEPATADDDTFNLLAPLVILLDLKTYATYPLTASRLNGVLIVDLVDSHPLTDLEHELLLNLSQSAAVALHNARHQNEALQMLADEISQMNLLQQIDRELNENISLDSVFNMTLDWGLRFCSATAGFVAVYDHIGDNIRTAFHYGYDATALDRLEEVRIALRVARSGEAEIMPDLRLDEDYFAAPHNILSQLAVPVMREDRVIAVITLESKKADAFTDNHQDFLQKLANRAAVAIDNARLYTESVHEREKLSSILSYLAEAVIVVDPEGRILLMNQSTFGALQLYQDRAYIGQLLTEAIGYTPLVNIYRRVRDMYESVTEELLLPNGRTFHTNAAIYPGIGCIIVMQDITPYKEMDKLKGELIATVSHDLKQPLSVMLGYLDLLQMRNQFNDVSQNYVQMIERAIRSMRQLIDDLLDMARVESGLRIEMKPVPIRDVLMDSIIMNQSSAEGKSITVHVELPEEMPAVDGERQRLYQIFNNLISNAVKYTQPEGSVYVRAEQRGTFLRISVQDNGIGISPDDMAHIFERFYRVRRPETDSIEGTGLGLAIVRALVEAHNGKIRVESRLNEGSTFFVTLPVSDFPTF